MTSTAESTNATAPAATASEETVPHPSPAEEIAGRIADQSPLWPIAHAAGLQNLRGIWADSAIKRRMDRLAQAKALGVEEALQGNQEMPGDISVKRDEIHHHYPATPAVVQQQPENTKPIVAAQRKLWPVIIAAALSGGAGACLPLAYQWLTKPAATPAIALPDYQLRLEVKDKP